VSSHLSNGVLNYEGLPSFLPTLFPLFPSQNSSPQDLRCSDSILISSTKTREQCFPRFTPSVLPRGQCYHNLFILHRSLRPFYTRRSLYRFVWSYFDHTSFPNSAISTFTCRERVVTDLLPETHLLSLLYIHSFTCCGCMKFRLRESVAGQLRTRSRLLCGEGVFYEVLDKRVFESVSGEVSDNTFSTRERRNGRIW
jgi:hypothetical protein